MQVATTIQISREEDQEIVVLKKQLCLPSKKAVVLEGIRSLQQKLKEQDRVRRLQAASKQVRTESQRINQEWAPHASATRIS